MILLPPKEDEVEESEEIQELDLGIVGHGPAGLTAATNIMLLVIPPKLKAVEGIVFMVPDTQNTIGIE